MIKPTLTATGALLCALLAAGCGDSGSRPTPVATPPPTPPAPPTPSIQVETLITVYRNAGTLAEFTEGTTNDERIGEILLGVTSLTTGTTVLNNENLRVELQQAVNRVNEDFTDADFEEAFGETKQNLRRFFNDADNDGWSVDGRHGAGRDWPHDGDGNDPDGWLSQMIVTVSRP